MVIDMKNFEFNTREELNTIIAQNNATIKLDGKSHTITSVKHAKSIHSDYRDGNGLWEDDRYGESLGSSEMQKNDGHIVIDNIVVAHISYNGRIWKGNSSVSITETKMEI